MANEHSLLFTGPMVRAILEDRKWMTRRLVTKQTSTCGSARWEQLDIEKAFPQRGGGKLMAPLTPEACSVYGDDSTLHRVYPRWEAADRLWVKETCAWSRSTNAPKRTDTGHPFVIYRAAGDIVVSGGAFGSNGMLAMRWTPGIYMPRWASRITLEVTAVRVERLHDISADDVVAEGIRPADVAGLGSDASFVQHYAALWDAINGKRATWASNPWVWKITFAMMP